MLLGWLLGQLVGLPACLPIRPSVRPFVRPCVSVSVRPAVGRSAGRMAVSVISSLQRDNQKCKTFVHENPFSYRQRLNLEITGGADRNETRIGVDFQSGANTFHFCNPSRFEGTPEMVRKNGLKSANEGEQVHE